MSKNQIPSDILDSMCTSIFLGANCEKLNQFMYASQLYGTFFCVYGVFEASKTEYGEKKIDKITLNILNYKGQMNMGLVRAYYDKKKATIILHVRGMTDPQQTVEVDFEGTDLFVENGGKIELYRVLDRLSSAEADVDKHFVFDTEYYGRDGQLMYPKIRYEQLTEPEIKTNLTDEINHNLIRQQKNDITDSLNDAQGFAPGRRCVPTTMIVRF